MNGSASALSSATIKGALNDQAGDEGDIARERVELDGEHRVFCQAGRGEGGCRLWPVIESVGTLACFHLGELPQDDNALAFSEADHCRTLSFKSEA